MPVTGKLENIKEEGQDKEAFCVSFTNGAKQQLEELKEYFKAPDLTEVVKFGISFLQRLKEMEEKKKVEAEGNEQK